MKGLFFEEHVVNLVHHYLSSNGKTESIILVRRFRKQLEELYFSTDCLLVTQCIDILININIAIKCSTVLININYFNTFDMYLLAVIGLGHKCNNQQ